MSVGKCHLPARHSIPPYKIKINHINSKKNHTGTSKTPCGFSNCNLKGSRWDLYEIERR